MKFFDERPKLFQLLFAVLAAILLAFASIALYLTATSVTDENVFVDASSFVYVTTGGEGGTATGDVVLALSGHGVATFASLEDALRSVGRDSLLSVTFFRPAEQRKFTVTVTPAQLASLHLREIPNHVRVTSVAKDGASDRAGMKVGDLILRIKGQPFTTAQQADSLLKSGKPGTSYTYTVLRDNREIELYVTLASIGFTLRTLAFAMLGLLTLTLSFFLAATRPALIGARYLALATLFLGICFFIPPITLRLAFWSSVCFCFGVAVFAHALHYFPTERPELISRRWFRRVLYFLAVLPFLGLAVAGTAGAVIAQPGVVLATAVLFLLYRKRRPPEHAKRLRPFAVATSTVLGLMTLAAIAKFSNENPPLPVVLAGWAIPLSLFYIIGRYRVFDLTFRIRKNIQYNFASAAWTILMAGLFCWLIIKLPYQGLKLPNVRLTASSVEVLPTPLQQQEQTVAEKTVLMLVAVLLALVFWRIGRTGSKFLSDRFYRGEYDYRRATSEMAEVMGTNLNMEDLAKGVAQKLSELMRLKRVGVMFFKGQSLCCCQQAHGFDGEEWGTFCLTHNSDLADWLKAVHRETTVDSLPLSLREDFRAHNIHIVVPIRSKEKLIGALLVGEKRSESAFRQEDYEFLSATAKQASVAVENSFLYEELAEQERMKHELEIARQIQLGSLPQKTPQVEGLEIAGVSIPAFEVGGDYFDYLNGHADKLTVIVGDVSGKGTSAAIYMSKVQGILRSLYGFGLSPRELFIRTNAILRADIAGKSFVTALGATFDVRNKRVLLARAGHLPLFYFNAAANTVQKVHPKGLGMGISTERVFADNLEEQTLRYSAGDVFVFATDGITEGRTTSNEEFGDVRVASLLTSMAGENAGEIRDHLLSAVKAFSGAAQQHDDQTVVVVKAE
jgi:serine phosphatase RsbU (regulator of sigma subunit)